MPFEEVGLPAGHVLRNRSRWDQLASEYLEPGRRAWAAPSPRWGIWGVPEAQLGLLPDLAGLDAVELGCGTGYVSSWLARRGARPVGIDNSPAQLASARGFQREFGLEFPLVHGDAERLPFAAESFDFAISEYGAGIWCDPRRWIPEAARVLRPGGHLTFLVNSSILMLCMPDDEDQAAAPEMIRDYFGMGRSNGRTIPASSFTSATATGSGCSAAAASRFWTWSRSGPRRARPPATPS